MKNSFSKEGEDEFNKSQDKPIQGVTGVYFVERGNQQHLLKHAKSRLQSRLYEQGVQHISMPSSVQKIFTKPNEMIPSRVIKGYKFYQTRQEETSTIPKQKLNVSNNLNNISNLVGQSIPSQSFYKRGVKLPKISQEGRRSRSALPKEPENPKNLLDESQFGASYYANQTQDKVLSKLNKSFGGMSPIRNNKFGDTQDASLLMDDDPNNPPDKRFELNVTYDENTSKVIINKLTGKNIPPTRIPYPPRFYRSNSVRSRGLSFASENEDAGINILSGVNDLQSGKVNQLQDIDSFIYLIKEGKINPSEFIYLVRKDGDHYNLKVTDYCSIKDNIFWTLSAKGVTKYEGNFPIEFIPLKDWLRERDQYNHIKRLRFFKQFRSWKTLKKWIKILRRNQRNATKAQLNDKLFIANPLFQKIIKQHKEYCLEIESLRFVDLGIQMQQFEVQSLEDFKINQEKQRQVVVENLQEYSQKLHDNARTGIKKILEKLRDHIIDEMANDEDKGQDELRDLTQEGKQHGNTKNVFEALGFPEFMNYGHRSMLRRECSRFLRLAYLLDFMVVEALGNMYIGSANDMVQKFRDLCKLYEPGPKIGSGAKKQYIEPLFYVNIEFVPNDIDSDEIKRIDVGNEVISPEDFDLECFAQFKKEIKVAEETSGKKNKKQKEEKVEEEIDVERIIQKRIVNNLHEKWFSIIPTLESFKRDIENFFETGIESIQVIERWSKHTEFQPYADALEEWDEIIGEKWIMPENKYLNILWYLKENRHYKSFEKHIDNMLDDSFVRITGLLSEFNYYLDFYWRDMNTSFQILNDDRLKEQSFIYQMILKLYRDIAQKFEENIISQADLGLIRVELADIKKVLVPCPSARLKSLEEELPLIMRRRVVTLREWLAESVKKLSGIISGIEEFIEQKNNFNKIIQEYENKKSNIETLYDFWTLLQENQIPLTNDDKDQFSKVGTLISDLNASMQSVEMAAQKNTDRFTKTLADRINKLFSESTILREELTQGKYLESTDKIEELIEELHNIDSSVVKLEETSEKYKFYEEILQVQEYADFTKIDDVRNELNLRLLLWKSKQEWEQVSMEWMGLPFNQINAKELGQKADTFAKNVYKCEKNLPESVVIRELKKKVYAFRDTMPVVTALRSPFLKEIHWEDIKRILKQDFNIEDETFTLSSLMNLNVADYQEDLLNVATQATQEHALEGQINTVEAFWKETDLVIENYKGLRDTYIIKDVDEISTKLDEYLSTMSNILASRYVRNLRTRAEKIQGDLLLLADVLDKWLECQKKWMYLENIFSGPDIKKQLAEENSMFVQCDKNLKGLFKRATIAPNTMRIIKIPNIFDTLCKTSDTLDVIERRLEDYLELKRGCFPRFYFISNDELLEILAKSQNIDAVQKHLRKCFENIIKIQINSDGRIATIVAMVSGEGEIVPFNKTSLQARGQVEVWLDALQKNMFEILQKLIRDGLTDLADPKYKTRNSWVLSHFGQVVSVVSHISWCNQTEEAINDMSSSSGALEDFYDLNLTQLGQLTDLVRSNITSLQRKIVVALITQDVHARDIVEKLKNEAVESVSNFVWQQQLRYYWDVDREACIVKQVTSVLNYGYEYLGATSRLVITPLTDRCWITITGAINMQLGASPAGPAGTGKTESTKDLAKGLGILCVVFNCSDQITTQMMSKLFSGLAQQGAWACLDEFNRIDVEVLSVIAQQLLTVRLALINNLAEFEFEGRTIPLKRSFGAFITMNPGYAGRTELPDNLKLLFRPVSMMIPDYGLIAEIMLFAEGFKNAKPLSKKMVQLYKLSSEQLSQQDHYDFGMRAVKSVLVMAGALKRAEKDLEEDVVLIRAMRDSNIPKFLKDDLPLFQALIQDLFPGVEIPAVDYGALQTQIVESLADLGLQRHPEFELKVVQLFETFNVRFGVMIVGPTGSGKSKCYRTLQHALTNLRKKTHEDQRYQRVEVHFLNPKSISMGELYGEINEYTQEWQDGLAASIVRNANQENPEDLKQRDWVVFDGPVDALWIENMNTVLDDNMTLCLANGERIKLRQELRMLFEVQDLAVASPATVSRCGMVYMNHDCLGWFPYVKSWMERNYGNDDVIQHRRYFEFIINMFQNTFDAVLTKMKVYIYEPIPTVPIQMASNICNFLQALLKKESLPNPENIDDTKRRLNYIFAFAFIWGMGGSLDVQSHDRFDSIIKDTFRALMYPKNENVFDYFVDEENGCIFSPWELRVEEFEYIKDTPYFQLLVPTTDTAKYSSVMELLISNQKSTFLTGVTGVGKSVITQNLLFKLKEVKSIIPVLLSFSAQTSSKETQLTIENKLNKKTKTVYGARPGEKIAIFIDDVNMPLPEVYGAQPPIELLRQYLDFGGLYDRQKLMWKTIDDTVLVCAAAPPGGGRNFLTPRFTRHFNMICAAKQTEKIMTLIFGKILTGFFDVWKFPEAVKKNTDNLVKGTIEIFMRISQDLLPTPAKFHYTFNLRDISKVFQGMLMVKPQSCSQSEDIVRLWIHENSRVFGDRLTNNEDREWFGKLIIQILSRTFGINWNYEAIFLNEKITYGDLLKLEAPQRLYEEIRDKKKLFKVLEDKQEEHNMNSPAKLNLVFFEDAVDHIVRISRILRQPRGNAMLIGVGGSGKQSLARLSSFLLSSEVFQIELAKNYNKDSFKQDLMLLMIKAGVERLSVTFLFTDSQIADEIFLEYINNMLNSGEVPNLFTKKEDYEDIINRVRPYNKSMKRVDSPDVIYSTFIQTVQDNLHIVLCMSPVGENLRVWCRKFPSLVNCCTLDWFSAWPEDALKSVAYTKLADIQFKDDKIRQNLAEIACEINISVANTSKKFYSELKRHVYNTPKSYLDSILLYTEILQRKRNEFNKTIEKLKHGMEKLKQTNELVGKLQIQLKELQPQLEEQTKKTELFLKKLAEDTVIANEKERLVQKEVEVVNRQAQEIKVVADEAEAELNKALPALIEAENALKNLNKAEISEIRTFTNPPDAVRVVMEAVCVLLGEKPDWASAKQVLMDMNFLERLNTYDKNNVPETILRKLRTYTVRSDFEPDFVAQKNLACKSLCLWCRAVDGFCKVNKEVEPKRRKMAEMSMKLDIANKELNSKQTELERVRLNLAKLQKECDDTMQKKENLMKEMELTRNRVENATKLTSLLADEGVRWKEQVERLDSEYEKLVGNVFISAVLISYLGPFTGIYRKEMIDSWLESMKIKSIPMLDDFSLSAIAGDPIQIRDWISNGLPSDSVSIDNGIITNICSRWPLLIDPQIQANKWIKNMEKDNHLIVMKFSDPNLLKNFQGAIASGYPVLIEDIEERMEPSIDPILQKAISNIDGRKLMRVGDASVDYNPQFRLYITTKLPNPHYLPEVCIRVTLVNFTVTFEGLEDQLLGDVVKQEQPAVEKQRDEIVVTVSRLNKSLKELQDRILENLAASKGMILDDVNLIETLEDSKTKSAEVSQNLMESQEVEKVINQTRSAYIPVAVRGAILYFVVTDLAGIDPMYQNSLSYFKRLFNYSIETSPKSNHLEERLETLIRNITKNVYVNVCRGLFEAHKKIFSFIISTSINRKNGSLPETEWNLFLRGPPQSAKSQLNAPNPDPKLLTDLSWEFLQYLGKNFKRFDKIHEDFAQNPSRWENFLFSEDIYHEQVPGYEDIENFSKLLIIRAVKAEQIVFAVVQYVSQNLGKFYEESASASMDEVYSDSDCKTPVIFILSQGADPSDQLIKFARERGFDQQFAPLSLGQGQGKKAAALIQKGIKEGTWVLLQNCHLAKSWMPDLEKIVDSLATSNKADIHESFRLFLTSMPTAYFPVSVLQNGLKMTTEPPRGLKANLKRSFQGFSQQMLDDSPKPEVFRKLLFGLTFFHAIIQERRKFGPLGFNIRYEFNSSDLDVSVQTLKMFLNEKADDLPWDAMLYVTGHINYGGRVTDDLDRICLLATLRKYYVADILQPEEYLFSDSGLYFAPKDGPLETYREYIESLPLNDNPEIFGMHENANITFLTQESNKILEAILIIQPRLSDSSQEKSTDDIVSDIAKSLLKDLPLNLNKDAGNKKLFEINELGLIPSLSTVLLQEMQRFNNLLEVIRHSLDQLQKAIKGFVVMSQELDQMYTAFINNQLPNNWKRVSYPSLKPLGSWYLDLLERVSFMEKWLMGDNPISYWLSGFFFPQGFMTGVLQTHARKYKIAIDKLSFKFKIMTLSKETITLAPVVKIQVYIPQIQDGVYIYGLFLDGARWDDLHQTLADQFPGELFTRMPPIHFIPAEGYVTSEDDYKCPVYKTSVRAGVLSTTGQSTNFILSVDLPSKNEKSESWTLKGTALLSQLDT